MVSRQATKYPLSRAFSLRDTDDLLLIRRSGRELIELRGADDIAVETGPTCRMDPRHYWQVHLARPRCARPDLPAAKLALFVCYPNRNHHYSPTLAKELSGRSRFRTEGHALFLQHCIQLLAA